MAAILAMKQCSSETMRQYSNETIEQFNLTIMLTYILKVTICWAVFYSLYALLLRKETFFKINRWYLLGTLIVGLCIPLIQWQPSPEIVASPTYAIAIEPIQYQFQQLDYRVETVAQPKQLDWTDVLFWVYLAGVVVVSFRFLYGIWRIVRLYNSSAVEQQGRIRVVYTPDYHLPFSFFNYLFWSKSFEADLNEKAQILRHEEAHIQQWHTLDVLFLEALNIVFWCSPILYFYRKSLRTVHEYLADALVLETTHRKQYGRLLLKQSMSGLQIALANNFINSQLKDRILMMTRKKSAKRNLARYLAFSPLLLLAVLLFSQQETRTLLKNQMDYFKTDDQQLEAIFNSLDSAMRMVEIGNTGTFPFIEIRDELRQKHPTLREEIDLLTHRATAKNGLSFYHNEFRRHIGTMKVGHCGEVKEKDINNYKAPQFGDCNDIRANTAIKEEICREKALRSFMKKHVWIPEDFEIPAGDFEVVHLELFIDEYGLLTEVKSRSETGLEEVAEAVVLKMPTWLPALSNNKPIAASLLLSFVFDNQKLLPFDDRLIKDHFRAAFSMHQAEDIISSLDDDFSYFFSTHSNQFEAIEDLLFEILQEKGVMDWVQFDEEGNWKLGVDEERGSIYLSDVVAEASELRNVGENDAFKHWLENANHFSEATARDNIRAVFAVEDLDLEQRGLMLTEDFRYFNGHFEQEALKAIYKSELLEKMLVPMFIEDGAGNVENIIVRNKIQPTLELSDHNLVKALRPFVRKYSTANNEETRSKRLSALEQQFEVLQTQHSNEIKQLADAANALFYEYEVSLEARVLYSELQIEDQQQLVPKSVSIVNLLPSKNKTAYTGSKTYPSILNPETDHSNRFSEAAILDHIRAVFAVEDLNLEQRSVMLSEDYRYFSHHYASNILQDMYRKALYEHGFEATFITGKDTEDRITLTAIEDKYLLKQELPELKVQDFKISPNPSNGNFQLQFKAATEPVSIAIETINGVKVYEQQFQNFGGTFDELISLNIYIPGIHIVVIEQGGKRFTRQLLVQ